MASLDTNRSSRIHKTDVLFPNKSNGSGLAFSSQVPGTGNDGFTILELIVVITIIGILATIGIPFYKTHLQRARKSEAKINLGSLFQVEQGFFSEWGGFGARLDLVGFEMEAPLQYYTIGFVDTQASCVGILDRPESTSQAGLELTQKNPNYYVDYTEDKAVARLPFIDQCQVGSIAADGSSFTATATGRLLPSLGVNPSFTSLDVWQIDESKNISNTQDGVQ